MKKHVLAILAGCLLLVSCNQKQHAMQPQLNSIRVMIKQAALMAGEAACADTASRNDLIHAAAVMDRRAMGGPEMAKIHKMMNVQPDAAGGKKVNKGKDMPPEMKQHVALHDAGEDVFDFLDGVSSGDVSCKQAVPMQLAALSAMLREAKGNETEETARKLDARTTGILADKKIPDSVRVLTRALQRI